MKIHHETIKEFGHALIHLGEASIIGGVAALFVQGFSFWICLSAFTGGLILIFAGLFFSNKCYLKEQSLKEQSSL
jgi:hypothetical protein